MKQDVNLEGDRCEEVDTWILVANLCVVASRSSSSSSCAPPAMLHDLRVLLSSAKKSFTVKTVKAFN